MSLSGEPSFIHLSYEHKLNERFSITPRLGFGWAFAAGSGLGKKFFEFGVAPALDVDAKYYFKLKNTNRRGKINSVYSGTYISLNPFVTSTLLGDFRYIYSRPFYGTTLNVGKQIQKHNNWYFNYYLGYTLFIRSIKTKVYNSETFLNYFFLGLGFGYSLSNK